MSKRREYLQRVLEVENGAFTPLVFGTNGGLGEECAKFLSALSSKIAKKDDESYAHTITWIRTRLSFDIMRSSIACVRGSRTPFRRDVEPITDFEMMSRQGDLARICWAGWERVWHLKWTPYRDWNDRTKRASHRSELIIYQIVKKFMNHCHTFIKRISCRWLLKKIKKIDVYHWVDVIFLHSILLFEADFISKYLISDDLLNWIERVTCSLIKCAIRSIDFSR